MKKKTINPINNTLNELRKEKVTIENYDIHRKQYDLGYCETTELSNTELICIIREFSNRKKDLKKLSIFKRYIYPSIRLITEKYIFTESLSTDIKIKSNKSSTKTNKIYYNINNLEGLFDKSNKINFKKKSFLNFNIIFHIFCSFLFLMVIYINSVIICLNWDQFKDNQTKFLFSVLLILSIISIGSYSYLFIKVNFPFKAYKKNQAFKSQQIIPIKNRIPYMKDLEPTDLSTFLIISGQLFYYIIFDFYSLSYHGIDKFLYFNQTLLNPEFYKLIGLFLILSTIIFVLYLGKQMKDIVLQNILERFLLGSDMEKLFYQNLYLTLKNQKLFKLNLISKIISLIIIIISVYQFIS